MDQFSSADSVPDSARPEPGMATFDREHRFEADVFAQLATELHDAGGVDETVDAVVQFALQAEACTYAGVTLAVRGGRAETAAVSDPAVEAIYQVQNDTGEGPMLLALTERATVSIPDVSAEGRWPAWSRTVLAAGVRSVLYVPMVASGWIVGVLSLYNAEPHAFTADDEAIAHILARHASVAVASARQDVSMAAAIDARKLVGQAMGILMERYAIDGDRAFAILRRYSQDTNTKLRDVAQQLIDTRKLPR